MKTNVGKTDKIVRILLAVIAVALAATGTVSGTLATVFYVAAAALLLTSLVGFCGLYTLFGINTCKVKEA